MNILFLDAYFAPETIAYTHLETDLLDGLTNEGHKVQVICPVPTRGINEETRKRYKKQKRESLYGGAVTVRRFWAPQEGKNPIVRAFRYFWCNLRTYQIATNCCNVDVVFSNSTPPTQGALSAIVARKLSKKNKRKIPFIFNLQDIFPDSLVNANMINERSILWKIGRRLEDFTYNYADKIILISQGFKRNIMAKGVEEEKIEVISNWIDLEFVYPVERKDNKLIHEFGLDPNKFIVVYAGNFGAVQGADIILKVADELKQNTNIHFVILGSGVYFEDARKKAEKLNNVFIHGLLPQNRVSEVYSLGDVALITCKIGTGRAGMPSKIWSIMACNTAIIASFDRDSDLADVICDSGVGECVEPENVEKLKQAIIRNYLSKNHNRNFRKYVELNASRNLCVKRFVNEFKLIGERHE